MDNQTDTTSPLKMNLPEAVQYFNTELLEQMQTDGSLLDQVKVDFKVELAQIRCPRCGRPAFVVRFTDKLGAEYSAFLSHVDKQTDEEKRMIAEAYSEGYDISIDNFTNVGEDWVQFVNSLPVTIAEVMSGKRDVRIHIVSRGRMSGATFLDLINTLLGDDL